MKRNHSVLAAGLTLGIACATHLEAQAREFGHLGGSIEIDEHQIQVIAYTGSNELKWYAEERIFDGVSVRSSVLPFAIMGGWTTLPDQTSLIAGSDGQATILLRLKSPASPDGEFHPLQAQRLIGIDATDMLYVAEESRLYLHDFANDRLLAADFDGRPESLLPMLTDFQVVAARWQCRSIGSVDYMSRADPNPGGVRFAPFPTSLKFGYPDTEHEIFPSGASVPKDPLDHFVINRRWGYHTEWTALRLDRIPDLHVGHDGFGIRCTPTDRLKENDQRIEAAVLWIGPGGLAPLTPTFDDSPLLGSLLTTLGPVLLSSRSDLDLAFDAPVPNENSLIDHELVFQVTVVGERFEPLLVSDVVGAVVRSGPNAPATSIGRGPAILPKRWPPRFPRLPAHGELLRSRALFDR